MGKTFVEKILSQKTGRDVKPGDIVVTGVDYVMSHDNTYAIINSFKKMCGKYVFDKSRVIIVFDHVVPPSTAEYATNQKTVREFASEQGIEHFYDINTDGGICHQILPEKGFALPGKVILGADSHTTTYGAFGAFSAGIGRSEVASIWATGEIWLKVPESIKVVVRGKPKGYITPKDIILYIIGSMGADGALYKSVEFTGPIIKDMTIAGRMVLTNMSAEMGAKNGYIAPDKKTFNFLKGRVREKYKPIYPDEDATYVDTREFDISNISPQVAFPHTVDNVHPIEEARHIKINEALIGTCTNGRLEDLRAAAKILNKRRVARNVRLLVLPASWEIYKRALKEGILQILISAGGIILNPGCGPCLGAHEGVLAPEETAISTANRNFKGRMGSRDTFIYLASPYTVAASAIAGEISDPRNFL